MNEELMKLIEEFIEIEEGETPQDEKLAIIGHMIDHMVLDSELIAITNQTEEYSEILRLTVEDENNSYFIPVFSDIDEAKKGIIELELDSEEFEYDFEAISGIDILDIAIDDESFVGFVINPYNTDFIVPKDDLIHTSQCNHNSVI